MEIEGPGAPTSRFLQFTDGAFSTIHLMTAKLLQPTMQISVRRAKARSLSRG
jgi:hypothetical protein